MDVRTVCLGMLTLGDASGYQIQKLVKCGCFKLFFDASYGSIYPALTKLTAEDFVTCTTESQDGKPDKKIYSITPEGRLEFIRSLSQEPAPDKFRSDFMARMLFSDLLLPGELSTLIDARVARHDEIIKELDRLLATELPSGEEFVIRYGRAMHEAASKFISENRHLVEVNALLAQMRETE